jgi:hypothetical protein
LDPNAAQSISGEVSALDSALSTNIPEITFRQLTLYLVSGMPSILTTSIWYKGPDGIGVVITKDNVIVKLAAGDEIIRDDFKGTVYGVHANGKEFTISANGTIS